MLCQDGVAYQRGVDWSTMSTIERLVGTVPPWFHRNYSTDLIPERRIPLRRNYQQHVSRPSPGALILIFLNVLVDMLEPPDDAPEVPSLTYEQCFGTCFIKVKVPVKFRSSSRNWIGTDWWLPTNPMERNGSELYKKLQVPAKNSVPVPLIFNAKFTQFLQLCNIAFKILSAIHAVIILHKSLRRNKFQVSLFFNGSVCKSWSCQGC